jgi:hypothetical protein
MIPSKEYAFVISKTVIENMFIECNRIQLNHPIQNEYRKNKNTNDYFKQKFQICTIYRPSRFVSYLCINNESISGK